MIYKNAWIFQGREGFVRGGIRVSKGRIREVFRGDVPQEGEDLKGACLIPGLVDIHLHGNSGCDFSDGSPDGLLKIGSYLAENGITSFAATSMTLPYSQLARAFQSADTYKRNRPDKAARLAGIHMEGPFLSEKKKGAQNAAYLKLPDYEAFYQLYEECGKLTRIVDVAPELPCAKIFAEKASKNCVVSIAHTNASYEETLDLFDAGASHVTHLFNAMPQIHHRNPGVIGAAADRENVKVELICDGLHVHPAIVRMAFCLFPGRICLISDSLRCCGMPDGRYELSGQPVFLKDRVARLEDGTIAGAASNLYEGMKNAISFGISREEAILSATLIPAAEVGLDKEIGSVEVGKYADFIVCDADLNLRQVFIGGICVRSIFS